MRHAVQPRALATAGTRRKKGAGRRLRCRCLRTPCLFIAIAFMVRWKSEPVGTVSAELWTLPPAAVQQPTPVASPATTGAGRAAAPEPEPRKADIVMEQKKAAAAEDRAEEGQPPDPPKKQDTKKVRPTRRGPEENRADNNCEAATRGRSEGHTESRARAGGTRRSGQPGGGFVRCVSQRRSALHPPSHHLQCP